MQLSERLPTVPLMRKNSAYIFRVTACSSSTPPSVPLAKGGTELDRIAVKMALARRDSTQTALARALGISVGHMTDLLYGRRNAARYIPQVAAHLGVPETAISRRVLHEHAA